MDRVDRRTGPTRRDGLLFGLLFAWVLAAPGLYRLTDWWWKKPTASVVYALVLGVAYPLGECYTVGTDRSAVAG